MVYNDFMFNEKVKNFRVSSADWSFLIDSINPKDAAVSAMLMAYSKYGDKLLLSTTIMIKEFKKSTKIKEDNITFIGTHDVLKQLGMEELSDIFFKISKLPKNDLKSIR
jgi:hypothetical protein